MSITRRRFLKNSAGAAATVAGTRLFNGPAVAAAPPDSPRDERVVPMPTGEWMSPSSGTAYRAYRSKYAKSSDSTTWVEIDLGEKRAIDSVKVYPANDRFVPGQGFPIRFKIEASSEPEFHKPIAIVSKLDADVPNPKGAIQQYPVTGVECRYVRLTATRLPKSEANSGLHADGGYYLAIGKVDVYSGGKNVAELCPVTADAAYGNDDDLPQITRPERAGGENTFMDHPENVTDPSTWKPPVHKVKVPRSGVTLNGGVFQTAMEKNIRYLLDSYSVDDLLRQFRERAGVIPRFVPPNNEVKFWEEDLAGSNAGRFMMAAGNTLRWMEHPELRSRLNAVVDGIAQYREPNGYIMAYPPNTILYSERGGYTRAWVTHGLIEAAYAGNPKAFGLLRGYYDWFNQNPYLTEMLRFSYQGGQGMVANSRLYFTPVGKPADIQVLQRYYQENFWMEELAAREERAVWQYPYAAPHCYLLTNLEGYMDIYLATGDERYLRMVEGAWALYHQDWENSGGSISIIEFVPSPPRSNMLNVPLGELCGNSFWTFLSQRFHLLDPENEKFVAEIEKSIYNVGLADLVGPPGFRYHTLLTHHKEKPTAHNSCCEGQGTRLIGSLPEHIYSFAPDGLYVNLYEPSTVEWKGDGATLKLKMQTRFPFDSEVALQFSVARPAQAKIRVRVPSWATRDMDIHVNGSPAAKGTPGCFVALDRTWSDGDVIQFRLPIALYAERYTGLDQIPGHARFAVSYGPILLAAVGAPEVRLRLDDVKEPADLEKRLKPKSGQPLHFIVENNPGIELMPYWLVDREPFNCFPAIPLRA
jgi:uncharacterized protein